MVATEKAEGWACAVRPEGRRGSLGRDLYSLPERDCYFFVAASR